MSRRIFIDKGYAIVDDGGTIYMETPDGKRHQHPTASAARAHIVKMQKADGVYGKGSFGNASIKGMKIVDARTYKPGQVVTVSGKKRTLVKRNDRNNLPRWETTSGGFFYEGDEDIETQNSTSFQNGVAKAAEAIAQRIGNAHGGYFKEDGKRWKVFDGRTGIILIDVKTGKEEGPFKSEAVARAEADKRNKGDKGSITV